MAGRSPQNVPAVVVAGILLNAHISDHQDDDSHVYLLKCFNIKQRDDVQREFPVYAPPYSAFIHALNAVKQAVQMLYDENEYHRASLMFEATLDTPDLLIITAFSYRRGSSAKHQAFSILLTRASLKDENLMFLHADHFREEPRK